MSVCHKAINIMIALSVIFSSTAIAIRAHQLRHALSGGNSVVLRTIFLV